LIEQHQPDVVFLDIKMPLLDGMSVAKALTKQGRNQQIVFVTALMQQLQQIQRDPTPNYLTWLKAAKGEDIHLISVDDVRYFKAEDKYVSLFTLEQGKKVEYLLRTSLKELMQQLDPNQFWQIHRSTIVNVAAIEKVNSAANGDDVAAINQAIEELSQATHALSQHMYSQPGEEGAPDAASERAAGSAEPAADGGEEVIDAEFEKKD